VPSVCPRPLPDGRADAGAHGVLDHVAARGAEVALTLDHAGGEAIREEVAEAAVALVEVPRITPEESLEAAGELRLRALEHEVEVRRHQAERVDRPAVELGAGQKLSKEEAPIVVVAKDGAAVDSARRDVEVPIGQRGSQHARHALMEAHANRCGAICGSIGTLFSHLTLLFRPCPGSDPGFQPRPRLRSR
jgi:hypothetical protein